MNFHSNSTIYLKKLQLFLYYYKKMDEETQRLKSSYEKLQEIDQVFKTKIQNGLLLFGNAQCGKTTTAYLLSGGHRMNWKMEKGRFRFWPDAVYNGSEIGTQSNNFYKIPTIFQNQRISIVDLPSFVETGCKFQKPILTMSSIYRCFQAVKNIKFGLVFSESDLSSGKSKEFNQAMYNFIELFQYDENFTIQDLAESTVLIVTKCNPSLDVQSVKQQIQMNIEYASEKNYDNYKGFLTKIISADKIYLIQAPVPKKQEKNMEKVYPEIKILDGILQNTKYWSRESIQGELQIKNVNYHIPHKFPEELRNNIQKNFYSKVFNNIQESQVNIIKLLTQSVQEVRKKILEDGNQYEFIGHWSSFIVNSPEYKKPKVNFNNYHAKYQYLNKIHLIRLVHEYINELNNEILIKDLFLCKKVVNDIINLFCDVLILKQNQYQIIRNFQFIVQRRFIEIDTLRNLSPSDKNNRDFRDNFMRLFDEDYQHIEKEFALKYQINLQENSKNYYSSLISIFQKYRDIQAIKLKVSQCNKKIAELNDTDQQDTIVEDTFRVKLNQTQKKSNNKVKNVAKIKQSIANYISSLIQFEEYNNKNNEQAYKFVEADTYKKLGDLHKKIGEYSTAISFYKVLGAECIIQIIECYENLNISSEKLAYMYNIQRGDFLRSILRFQDAIVYYQLACKFQTSKQKKIEAHKRVIETRVNQNQYIKQYEDKILKDEIYTRFEGNLKEIKELLLLTQQQQ